MVLAIPTIIEPNLSFFIAQVMPPLPNPITVDTNNLIGNETDFCNYLFISVNFFILS